MTEQKRRQDKQRVMDSDAENERRERLGSQEHTNAPFSSGRNRDMQTQRSNRQGSGQPTQQRREDR